MRDINRNPDASVEDLMAEGVPFEYFMPDDDMDAHSAITQAGRSGELALNASRGGPRIGPSKVRRGDKRVNFHDPTSRLKRDVVQKPNYLVRSVIQLPIDGELVSWWYNPGVPGRERVFMPGDMTAELDVTETIAYLTGIQRTQPSSIQTARSGLELEVSLVAARDPRMENRMGILNNIRIMQVMYERAVAGDSILPWTNYKLRE